jgi:predicted neutral ceramidase superfamily lipid hydrolase
MKAMGMDAFQKFVEMVIIDGNNAQRELDKKVERERKK